MTPHTLHRIFVETKSSKQHEVNDRVICIQSFRVDVLETLISKQTYYLLGMYLEVPYYFLFPGPNNRDIPK